MYGLAWRCGYVGVGLEVWLCRGWLGGVAMYRLAGRFERDRK